MVIKAQCWQGCPGLPAPNLLFGSWGASFFGSPGFPGLPSSLSGPTVTSSLCPTSPVTQSVPLVGRDSVAHATPAQPEKIRGTTWAVCQVPRQVMSGLG